MSKSLSGQPISLTARHNGRVCTYLVPKWAEIKKVTSKYLYQRKRNGYSDEETINRPKCRRYPKDPELKNKEAWQNFVFSGHGQENYKKQKR